MHARIARTRPVLAISIGQQIATLATAAAHQACRVGVGVGFADGTAAVARVAGCCVAVRAVERRTVAREALDHCVGWRAATGHARRRPPHLRQLVHAAAWRVAHRSVVARRQVISRGLVVVVVVVVVACVQALDAAVLALARGAVLRREVGVVLDEVALVVARALGLLATRTTAVGVEHEHAAAVARLVAAADRCAHGDRLRARAIHARRLLLLLLLFDVVSSPLLLQPTGVGRVSDAVDVACRVVIERCCCCCCC